MKLHAVAALVLTGLALTGCEHARPATALVRVNGEVLSGQGPPGRPPSRPMVGVTVAAFDANADPGAAWMTHDSSPVATAVTASDGRFTMRLPSGNYNFRSPYPIAAFVVPFTTGPRQPIRVGPTPSANIVLSCACD